MLQLCKEDTVTIEGGRQLGVQYLKSRVLNIDYIVQPMADTLLQAPGQESPDNILNILPVESLATIFKASTLNVMDLLEISNVCSQFNAVARAVFETKYKSLTFHKVDRLCEPLWRIVKLFRTFGPLITKIHWLPTNIACSIVAEYCPKITDFQCSLSSHPAINDMRTLFTRLDKLCMSLAPDLDLDGNPINKIVRLPDRNLPHLVELNLCRVNLDMAEPFFRANAQLQELTLTNASIDMDINVLIDSLPNLSKLEIMELSSLLNPTDYNCNAQHTQFHTLELQIDATIVEYVEMILQVIVQHKIPLENLKLNGEDDDFPQHLDNFIDIIRLIPTIKWLHFYNQSFNDDQLVRLAHESPNLTKLSISKYAGRLILSGVRKFMEIAGNRLTSVHLDYKHTFDVDAVPFNAADLERMSRIAHDREICLQMRLHDCFASKNIDVSIPVPLKSTHKTLSPDQFIY